MISKAALRWFALVLLLAAACGGRAEEEAPNPGPSAREKVRVVRVHDGDTITVQFDGVWRKVRLICVDTPELNDRDAGQRKLARHARELARMHLDGRTVTLVADELAGDRDKYDRLLRYVMTAEGDDFGETLVRQGLARTMQRFPCAAADRYRAAEQEARGARLGIWSADGSS